MAPFAEELPEVLPRVVGRVPALHHFDPEELALGVLAGKPAALHVRLVAPAAALAVAAAIEVEARAQPEAVAELEVAAIATSAEAVYAARRVVDTPAGSRVLSAFVAEVRLAAPDLSAPESGQGRPALFSSCPHTAAEPVAQSLLLGCVAHSQVQACG